MSDRIAFRYFQQLVHEGLREEHVSLGQLAADYVVTLLVDAMASQMLASPGGGPPVLAWYHKAAVESVGQARLHAFRRLGDVALFLAGLFVDYVETSTGLGYYVDMGRHAYRSASVGSHSVLDELSAKFPSVVGALNAACQRTTLARSLSVGQLFELYERSGGLGPWARMVAAGRIPIIGAGAVG